MIVAPKPSPAAGLSDGSKRLAVRLAMKSTCSLLAVPPEGVVRLDRVLAPVRNSECSRRALQCAIDMANASSRSPEVIAYYAFPVPSGHLRIGLSYADFSGALQEHAEKEMERLLHRIEPSGAKIREVYVDDPKDQPAELIAQAVKDEKVDVVFIGSRGRSGAAGVLLGHVTEALVSSSPAPVMAVKKKGESIGLLHAIGILSRGG